MLEDPLHDAKVVHHLYERDEKDNGGQLGSRYMSKQYKANGKI